MGLISMGTYFRAKEVKRIMGKFEKLEKSMNEKWKQIEVFMRLQKGTIVSNKNKSILYPISYRIEILSISISDVQCLVNENEEEYVTIIDLDSLINIISRGLLQIE